MGTRAAIKLEGFEVCQMYKHWDGYPEATLPWLQKFNAEFSAHRKDDPEYKMAQLLRSSSYMRDEFGLDSSNTTGWGVTAYGEGWGQEFTYILMNDGSVKVLGGDDAN